MSTIDEAKWLADVDLEEDARQAIPQDNKLAMLTNLADHYETLEREIAEAEAKLKEVADRFRRLREEIIPEKMKELGVKRFVLDDGSELGYKDFYAGKILDTSAYDWLEQNGYSDAVKMELKLETNRTDRKVLDVIREYLMNNHPNANLSIMQKQNIHHMTLGAVIKELNKIGRLPPQDIIETFIGNRATLKGAKPNG